MKGKSKILYALMAIASFISCSKTVISDKKEYLSYLANPENGLTIEKVVTGLKMKIRYMPEDYLVYNNVKEMVNCTSRYKDSIAETYHHSLTFMVNIGPDENENFDLTRLGISSYGEFAERIEEMTFNSQNWFALTSGGKLYTPVLTKMENVNALEKSRDFIVVFNSTLNSPNDITKNDMIFIYTDDLFHTGVHKFQFNTEDIKKLPKFKF